MAKEPSSLGRHGARLVLEYTGIGRVLRSNELREDIDGRAHRIAVAAEAHMDKWTNTEADNTGDPDTAADNTEGELEDYEVRVFQGRDRVRAVVSTKSLDAKINEQYNRSLDKSIDAARGSVDL